MLPVVHHAVFGAYTCIAENIHGKLEKVVMLTEGAKPGTPHINPLKIYPDGLDLYIEVNKSLHITRNKISFLNSFSSCKQQCHILLVSWFEMSMNFKIRIIGKRSQKEYYFSSNEFKRNFYI